MDGSPSDDRVWSDSCRCQGMQGTCEICVTLRSEPLSRDHLLNDFRFVIDDEMRVALHHRERFVPEHVCDFEQLLSLT